MTSERRQGGVDFGRHFTLLGCILVVLAGTNPWRPSFGAVLWFGIYGALHSGSVVLTWRVRRSWRRLLGFVALASGLSMLSAVLGLYATRHSAHLAALGPALPLALSSGFGAASYALLFRWLGETLPWSACVALSVGCVVATALVLVSGIYRYGGGLWFAAAWWLAFSAGLWFLQGRGAANPLR